MRPPAVLWRTLLLCLPLCSPARAVSNACSDPKSDAGLGSLSEIQWSYNTATDTCESFLYRGDGKSSNIFATEHQCMVECSGRYQDLYPAGAGVCSLSVDNGPCMAFVLVWYYDSVNKKCDTFFYGGCQGNGNRFDSRHNCISTCATARKGKSGSASSAAEEEEEPAPPSSNEGTIVAIVFSVIFAVAFAVTLTMFIRQRTAMKTREQKHKFVAVEMH